MDKISFNAGYSKFQFASLLETSDHSDMLSEVFKNFMKITIKIIFWIFVVITFLEALFITLSVWAPIYLMITKGGVFNWSLIILMFAKRFTGIFIALLLYSYIYKHRYFSKNHDGLLRVILILFYVASNFLFLLVTDFFFGPLQIMEVVFLIMITMIFLKTDKTIKLYKNL